MADKPRSISSLAMGAVRSLLVIWGGVCLAMWGLQERLLFPGAWSLPDDEVAQTRRDDTARLIGARVMSIRAEDGVRLECWYVDAGLNRTVLYVGGNAERIAAAAPLAIALKAQGWNLMVVSLRGYPGSEGSPSEDGFKKDIRAAWAWLTGPGGQTPDRIVLHGHSMGGGAIGTVLEEVRPAGIVLESTFTRMEAIASETYPFLPVRLLLRHPFDTLSHAASVQAPVLVVHSTDDEVVPVAHGRALGEAFPNVTYAEAGGLSHAYSVLLGDDAVQVAWRNFLAGITPR